MVDFTVISSKNVKVPSKARGSRVSAQDCVPVIFFPLGIPNMKEAIDRAIEGAGPDYDALVDGVVYQINQSFILGQLCYKVEGTPINTKSAVSLNMDEQNHLLFHSRRHDASPGSLTPS
jgi:hypothetical protein